MRGVLLGILIAVGGMFGLCTLLVIAVGTMAAPEGGGTGDTPSSGGVQNPSVRQPTPTSGGETPSVRTVIPEATAQTPPSQRPTPSVQDPPIDQTTPTAGPGTPTVRQPTPEPPTTATPEPGPVSDAAALVQRVKDGIVKVEAGWSASGSGFIFDIEGTTAFVATNHHVIEDESSINVSVRDSRTYEALVLGWDADRDVAVLAICCSDDFAVLPWEEISPDVGDDVVAVGYPRGGQNRQVTATIGVIAEQDSLSRRFDFISHTAPLNPGNSGGPLFSFPDGKVLGINTARGTQVLSFYAVPFQAVEEQLAEWRLQLVVP